MGKTEYVNVKIPTQLAAEIDSLVQEKHMGYRSRAEFVSEAIRRWLLDLSKYEPKQIPEETP